jgi:hypothetical protein
MRSPTLTSDEFIEKAQDDLLAAELGPDLIRVELSSSVGGLAAIDFLEIVDQANLRKGIAGRALRLLMQLADDSGFTLEVIPHSFDGPMNDLALRAWYERNGFRAAGSPDVPNVMRREPQA